MYITTKAAIPTNDGMAACVFYLHSIFRKSKIFPNLRCRLLSASHHGWQEGYEGEEAECQSADGADGEGEPEGFDELLYLLQLAKTTVAIARIKIFFIISFVYLVLLLFMLDKHKRLTPTKTILEQIF